MMPAANQLPVDEGAVAAFEILDEELVVDLQNLRVLTADRPLVEHNVALGMPAEHGPVALQRKLLAGIRSVNHLE